MLILLAYVTLLFISQIALSVNKLLVPRYYRF